LLIKNNKILIEEIEDLKNLYQEYLQNIDNKDSKKLYFDKIIIKLKLIQNIKSIESPNISSESNSNSKNSRSNYFILLN
jgi:hypothetical protein